MNMRRTTGILASLLIVMLLSAKREAFATAIGFEGLGDSTSVTNQYAAVTFTNATAITAGISLNELDFPPHSGAGVVFDDGGAISILFATPKGSVGGFFTYLVPLTLTAFDVLDNSVATATTAFSSNLALSGDPGSSPNEFLRVAFPGGITKVAIEGIPTGTSFTLDDLTVPGPPTFALLAFGLAGAIGWRRVRRVSRRGAQS